MNKQKKNIAIISAFVFAVILVIGLVMAAPLFKGKPQCKDGIDNDGDGLIDMKDPGCTSTEDRDEYNAPVCSDECSPQGKQQCFEDYYVITCGNFDSDSCLEWNTLGTYCIYGCSNGVCNSPPPVNETQCNDSLDNDGDGLVDMNDPGCISPEDDDEYNVPVLVNTCTDTENGVSIYVQGTVSGLLNGEAYSYADTCLDSIQLKEYYCAGNNYYSYLIGCNLNQSTSCVNGACQ